MGLCRVNLAGSEGGSIPAITNQQLPKRFMSSPKTNIRHIFDSVSVKLLVQPTQTKYDM